MNTVEADIISQLSKLDTWRQEQLMESVMSYTSVVVHEAMHGNWNKVLDSVEQRRHVMDRLVAANDGRHAECVSALLSAVEESERAVTRVVAHAIASSRWHGALFAMQH
jgi:hypothetical protein